MPSRRTALGTRPGTPNSRLMPVGRRHDRERIEAAPAFVAGEQLRVAGLQPQPHAVGQHLDQRADIAQAEVEPLPGDRVHAVRGIADQRQPLGRRAVPAW